MGIQRVLADVASSSGSSKSSGGFNWPAGNLSLQPSYQAPRESYTPTQPEVNSGAINPSYGGSIGTVQQAKPTQYGYAPAANGGQGINPNQPLSGPAGGGYQEPITPPAPPPPAVGGRQWYNNLDQGGKASADSQWLGGDSDYTAQIAEYDKALQSFVDRIANQRKGFTEDANLATDATNRNQTQSVNQLGEDFGARGLSYSGLFDTSKNEVNTRFNDAKSGIERMRAKNDGDAVNRQNDYQAENQISRGNAQRASLGRQAQRQALIDSMGA